MWGVFGCRNLGFARVDVEFSASGGWHAAPDSCRATASQALRGRWEQLLQRQGLRGRRLAGFRGKLLSAKRALEPNLRNPVPALQWESCGKGTHTYTICTKRLQTMKSLKSLDGAYSEETLVNANQKRRHRSLTGPAGFTLADSAGADAVP